MKAEIEEKNMLMNKLTDEKDQFNKRKADEKRQDDERRAKEDAEQFHKDFQTAEQEAYEKDEEHKNKKFELEEL